MRPIILKIKGVNSFIEESTIDFEKLTVDGLFGIFGPTGSGKSTILDGMTLALYGKMPRESSCFINVNCDTAYVSFVFEIAGKETHRFEVQRMFRRNKTDGVLCSKSKLLDITEGTARIIEEGVKNVNAKCFELLGLTLADFTRTVVLPQGKFSEFLKLTGADRREMLERLFGLEKFGEALDKKLKAKKNSVYDAQKTLSGELRSYEEVTEENKAALEAGYLALKKECSELIATYETFSQDFEQQKEIYTNRQALDVYLKQQARLSQDKERMSAQKTRLVTAQKAAKVLPYLSVFEQTQKAISKTQAEKACLSEQLKKATDEKNTALSIWESLKNKKEKEWPMLEKKYYDYQQCLKDKKERDETGKAIAKCIQGIEKIKAGRQADQAKFEALDKTVKAYEKAILTDEEKLNALDTPQRLKEKIQEGVHLETQMAHTTKLYEQFEKKKAACEAEHQSLEEQLKNLQTQVATQKTAYTHALHEKEIFIQKVPGTLEDVMAYQKNLIALKEKEETSKQYRTERDLLQTNLENLKTTLDQATASHATVEKAYDDLCKQQESYEEKLMAAHLREQLRPGTPCPVCGSQEHPSHSASDETVSESYAELKEKTEVLGAELMAQAATKMRLVAQYETLQGQYEACLAKQKELAQSYQPEDLKNCETQLVTLQKNMADYEKEKIAREKAVEALKDTYQLSEQALKTLMVKQQTLTTRLSEVLNEYQTYHASLTTLTHAKEKLCAETQLTDFTEANKQLQMRERAREMCHKDLRQKRVVYQENVANQNALKEQINHQDKRIENGETIISEKQKLYDKLHQTLCQKVAYPDRLEEDLLELENTLTTLKVNYEQAEKAKDTTHEVYQALYEKDVALEATLTQLQTDEKSHKQELDQSIQQADFKSIEAVRASVLLSDELERLAQTVENYANEVTKVQGAIQAIEEKLKGRTLTETEWLALTEAKKTLENRLETCKKELIQTEQTYQETLAKWDKLQRLRKDEAAIAKEAALLNELEKVFKGKRFVEFVATTRLKYIVKDASKRLKEISNGTYGLEIDDNGKFLVKDYKNGGILRDTNTLSGGETFLTSLALALALSGAMQLKGTAPLELFFLDEGFGTLDDEALDTVMNSLERLHHQRLKIGLISHVEAIKNRMPTKLIVRPATPGKGGTKVALEKS